MNKNNLRHSAMTAACGGASGLVLFAAFSGGFSGALKAASAAPYVPFLYAVIFSVVTAVLHAVISGFLAALFSAEREKISSALMKIITLPCAAYAGSILLILLEPKIAAVKLLTLGNVYLPPGFYADAGAAGYSFLMLFGVVFTLQILLLMFYFSYMLSKTRVFSEQKTLGKIVFIQFFALYAAAGFYTTFSYPPTGDEPYYLLMAESVIKGKGLNLESLYADAASYAKIFPGELDSSFRVHNAPGKNGGIYTLHPPAVSFLILPFYLILGRFGGQLVINALAALLAAVFFRAAAGISGRSRDAYIVTLVFFLSAPLFVNSSLILTEIPAALIILYACGEILKEKKNGFLFFLSLSFLPWLHMKLAVPAIAGACAYAAVKIYRKEKPEASEIKGAAAALSSAVLFALFYFSVFGVKAGSLYDTQDFKFVLDPAHSAKAFFAVLFDRNFGLFTYAPVYIFAAWGIAETALKKQFRLLLPLAIALPYACLYLFWNDWTGSMTPARQLIPVLPVFALYALFFFREKSRLFQAAALISVLTGWLLAAVPLLRYASSRDKIFRVIEAKAPGFMWCFPDFNAILTPAFAVSALYSALIIWLFFFIRGRKSA